MMNKGKNIRTETNELLEKVKKELKISNIDNIEDEIHLLFAKKTNDKNDLTYIIYDKKDDIIIYEGTRDDLTIIWNKIVKILK